LLKRVVSGVLCLIAVAILAGRGAALATPSPPVYSVEDVQVGLQRNAGAWIGRTVLIRGQDVEMGITCASSSKTCYRLPGKPDLLVASPDPRTWTRVSRVTPPLVLIRRDGARVPVETPPSAVAVRLSHLPFLGALIPASLLERGAVYRVRLRAPSQCTLSPCEQGELE